MANKVQIKKSSVVARVPLTTDIDYGELALNYADGKLYYKKSDGTTIDHFPSVNYVALLSGSYANPSWITSLDGSKITGDISGSASAVPWSGVTSKPTTLSGYGITDAYSSSNPAGYITGTGSITGSAGSISGYNNPTTAPTGNTIVYRDASGDVAAREIVLSSGLSAQTPTVLVSMYPTTNQMVRTTPTAVASAIQSVASGTWGISISGNATTASNGGVTSVNGATGAVTVETGGFASGTRLPFAQASAPTGWTQDTSDNANNRMLRVVNTAGNGVGGSSSPILNNVVPSHTHGFSTGTQSANHNHGISDPTHRHDIRLHWTAASAPGQLSGRENNFAATRVSEYAGTGISTGTNSVSHTHSGTTDNGSSQTNWTPRYIDMIICTKG